MIIVIPLIIGGLIYLSFRSDTLKMFQWIDNSSFGTMIENLRNTTITFRQHLPNWFLFSLPDGLWIFSYISTMMFIWNYELKKSSIIWILLVPFIGFLSEFGQLLKFVSGTFDKIDVLFYIFGTLFPFILFKNKLSTVKVKKNA